MNHPLERRYPPAKPRDGSAWLLRFDTEGNLRRDSSEASPDLGRTSQAPRDALYIGDVHGVPVLAWEEPVGADNDQTDREEGVDLRTVVATFPANWAATIGYAVQLLHFRREHRFCSRCGTELESGEMWSRQCPGCGRQFWPPVSPAVLLLIHDHDGNILLAQKPGWGERWSILAGFVEPGESLEECCRREAMEEVGVVIESPCYLGSQTWPFPHQLMVAFTARYVSGDIVPDPGELADARWFPVSNLPKLPPPHALSRQAIDTFLRNLA